MVPGDVVVIAAPCPATEGYRVRDHLPVRVLVYIDGHEPAVPIWKCVRCDEPLYAA